MISTNRPPPPAAAELAELLARRIAVNGSTALGDTVTADHKACSCRERRARSLRHCHMPAELKRARHPSPRDSGAYVPELAASLDNDRNLTDGARRCARKLVEYVYRKNRDSRQSHVTVRYLSQAMGRCRRSVQRYLRQLEREGYIEVLVVPCERTRMCSGLLVRVLDPLLPKHRRHKWPEKAVNSGATVKSQIKSQGYKRKPMHREIWAFLCSEGVWRSYVKSRPPLPPFPTALLAS